HRQSSSVRFLMAFRIGYSGCRYSVPEVDPRRRVVARPFPAAHVATDARVGHAIGHRRTQQQVIDAKPGVAPVRVTKEIPEGVDRLLGIALADRVGPTLAHEPLKLLAHLNPEEGVVGPALGLVDVTLGRDDVVVAGEYHRGIALNELRGVLDQAIEPLELVV